MANSYLFVAVASESWGEVLMGRRIATALSARGDRVAMVAPSALAPALDGSNFRVGYIDRAIASLPEAVHGAARNAGVDAVILLDVVTVYMQLEKYRRDRDFLGVVGAPVWALDVWDVERTTRVWDLGEREWIHSTASQGIEHRLVPAPTADPRHREAGTHTRYFDALPELSPLTSGERAEARASIGAGPDQRVVFMTTARWQRPGAPVTEAGRRSAEQLPGLMAKTMARLPASTLVVHIAAEPDPWLGSALGDRYLHHGQCPPERFRALLGASDVLFSCNTVATTIATALVLGVPVVLRRNSYAGDAGSVSAALGEDDPEVSEWLEAAAPLYPFAVWPLGLASFLAPVLADNLLIEAIDDGEVLDVRGTAAALERCAYDSAHRGDRLAAQRDYVDQVRSLPSAVDVIETWTRGRNAPG